MTCDTAVCEATANISFTMCGTSGKKMGDAEGTCQREMILSDKEEKKRDSGWREQIKCCNECAVILAVLISLFVYFSSHLPRHTVPQCFPSSLVRSYCCALMHVLGWCSCPEHLCLFVSVAQCLFMCVCLYVCVCVYTLAYFFLLIKLPWWSDTSCVSANSSCFWPFCRTCEYTHTHTHTHMHTCPHKLVMDGVITWGF